MCWHILKMSNIASNIFWWKFHLSEVGQTFLKTIRIMIEDEDYAGTNNWVNIALQINGKPACETRYLE